jgi:ankyrin repeat protein
MGHRHSKRDADAAEVARARTEGPTLHPASAEIKAAITAGDTERLVGALDHAFDDEAQPDSVSVDAAVDFMGRTCLHLAVAHGELECCRAILSLNTSPTASSILLGARDDKGFTPLHMAAESGRTELVGLLVQAWRKENDSEDGRGGGGDDAAFSSFMDARSARGDTPLFRAAFCKREGVCLQLIGLGADEEAENDDGKTPQSVREDRIMEET